MFHGIYEEMVRFSSEGQLKDEITKAKDEFIVRTGELFESDPSFERRIASFLEWYVLDRPVSFATHMTPAKLYVDSMTSSHTTPELTRLRGMTKTMLSLFEFKSFKGDHVLVVDLLNNTKQKVYERRRPIGVENGDLFEGRIMPYNGVLVFSDAVGYHPREARRVILKAAKLYRKKSSGDLSFRIDRIDMVHRIAYFANRCERYKHVDPRRIFAQLQVA